MPTASVRKENIVLYGVSKQLQRFLQKTEAQHLTEELLATICHHLCLLQHVALYKDVWPSPRCNYSLLVALISVDRCNEKHIINTEAEMSSCGSKHLGHSKMYILLDN